jgi:hypothetical protein
MTMRALPFIALGLVVLSACGQREAAATPVEPTPVAEPVPAAVAAPVSTETACRQAVQVQYGQAEADVAYDAGTVSWRAPVDGGRLSFTCAVQGAQVTLSRDGQTQIVILPTSTAGTVEKEAR